MDYSQTNVFRIFRSPLVHRILMEAEFINPNEKQLSLPFWLA